MATFIPITDEEKQTVEELKIKLQAENLSYEFTDIKVLRFLRGRKHDADKAFRAMLRHVQWREENKVDAITEESIATELAAQKVIMGGPDKEGRPIIFILARNHNKDQRDIDEMRRLIIYTVEKTMKLTNPSEEKMVICFDLTGFGFYCMDYEVVKLLISILDYNYPETLFLGILCNSPVIFSGCWLIIRPWLDPVTAAKVVFKSKAELTQCMDESVIPEAVHNT